MCFPCWRETTFFGDVIATASKTGFASRSSVLCAQSCSENLKDDQIRKRLQENELLFRSILILRTMIQQEKPGMTQQSKQV